MLDYYFLSDGGIFYGFPINYYIIQRTIWEDPEEKKLNFIPIAKPISKLF
jgi:hypothetical protein